MFQSVLFFLFLACFDGTDDDCREGKEGDDVGDDHDVIEHIGKLPDEIVGEKRAQENESSCQNRVDRDGNLLLFTEEILYVLLAEEVPADDRGEGEEGQANRDEYVAERGITKCHSDCRLHHVGFCDSLYRTVCKRSVPCVKRGDRNESGDGKNDKGIADQHPKSFNGLIYFIIFLLKNNCLF